jgi:hypothetical protein
MYSGTAYTLTLYPAYSSVITPAAFNGNAGIQTGQLMPALLRSRQLPDI